MVVDVYEQYFKAECTVNEVERRAALVKLTSDSEAGNISYTESVNFFPHRDEEDFAVSYDGYSEKVVWSAKGRRSKKREAAFMENLRETADELAEEMSGVIHWEEPLTDARLG